MCLGNNRARRSLWAITKLDSAMCTATAPSGPCSCSSAPPAGRCPGGPAATRRRRLGVFTRPSRPHFMRTRDEFAWRTTQLFDAIGSGTITVTVSGRYPLRDAAQAHRDLQDRKTVGSVVLTP